VLRPRRLRVGYALGSAEFRAAVDAVRQPFSVNALAQAAGAEAILHQDDVLRRVETPSSSACASRRACASSACKPRYAGQLLLDRPRRAVEAEVVAGLVEREIAVAPGTPLGSPGHIRVSYGTSAENDRFLPHFRKSSTNPRPRATKAA
jgi:histidinol-phosphate aminotransferase